MQKTALTIAEKAYQLSFDPDYMSPFALSAVDVGIQLSGLFCFSFGHGVLGIVCACAVFSYDCKYLDLFLMLHAYYIIALDA